MFVPCGEFMPDMPDFQNPGISVAHNVFPRTPQTYGPLAGFQSQGTAALDGTVLGAFATTDQSDNPSIFAGTADKLYQLASGGTAFTDVTATAGAYTAGTDWRFENFAGMVIATNFSNVIQAFTLGSSTKFAALSSSAPQARYAAAVKQWLMVANTYDGTNGDQPQRVQWSAVGDATTWPTVGSNAAIQLQSDAQVIPGPQGQIQGLVGNLGSADAAIFFERAIYRVLYTGSPTIFSILPAEGLRGTPAPRSIAQLGSVAFYLGEDGFYMFDGANSKPIGANKVDKYFYQRVNQTYINLVCGAVDPINRVVLWAYPGPTSVNGALTDVIIYNWSLDKWSDGDFSGEYLFRALSSGYSLEGLDVPSGSNLDTLMFSLDSRVWTGGSIIMGGFNLSHKFGYLNGSTLAATVETSEFEPYAASVAPGGKAVRGRLAYIDSAKPIVDGGTPSVSVSVRDRIVDTPITGAAVVINANGDCPQRADGRYVRATLTMPAGSAYTNISGVDLITEPTGTER